ncbi:MAG: hypothetical protein RLZ12_698 [Bacillota bacterium]|jgi:hypothetical protein
MHDYYPNPLLTTHNLPDNGDLQYQVQMYKMLNENLQAQLNQITFQVNQLCNVLANPIRTR